MPSFENHESIQQMRELCEARPVPQPSVRLVWHALVDVGPREMLGAGPIGQRFIVPILGGRFWGGPGFEAFNGSVRSGGADRQLLRPDGVKELNAEYEMETADGSVLTVLNEVLTDDSVTPLRYVASRIRIIAPAGPHAWLNRRLFVGSLQSLRPQREAVLVRGFVVHFIQPSAPA